MKALDVAIAGCGPGGLAAALCLHQAGHRVTLFERFPEPKPVGSGLMIQPTGMAVLDRLGLGGQLQALAAPIAGLHGLSMPSGKLALAMDYAALSEGLTAWGVHRSALFNLLFDAVKAHRISVETDREVAGSVVSAGDRRQLVLAGGVNTPPFDLIVDAMGARSVLSRRSADLPYGALWTTLDEVPVPGFLPDRLDQRYHLARQMAGILPLGRSVSSARNSVAWFWSLRLDQHDRWRSEGLEAWRSQALKLWPEAEALLAQITDPDQFVFASYQHRTLSSPVQAGLVHIGDAWHATSPQLGQGANMALLDAFALSFALVQAHDVPEGLARYKALRSRHVRTYQMLSRFFTPVFQSESRVLPLIRDSMMRPVHAVGLLRRMTAQVVSGRAVSPVRGDVL